LNNHPNKMTCGKEIASIQIAVFGPRFFQIKLISVTSVITPPMRNANALPKAPVWR